MPKKNETKTMEEKEVNKTVLKESGKKAPVKKKTDASKKTTKKVAAKKTAVPKEKAKTADSTKKVATPKKTSTTKSEVKKAPVKKAPVKKVTKTNVQEEKVVKKTSRVNGKKTTLESKPEEVKKTPVKKAVSKKTTTKTTTKSPSKTKTTPVTKNEEKEGIPASKKTKTSPDKKSASKTKTTKSVEAKNKNVEVSILEKPVKKKTTKKKSEATLEEKKELDTLLEILETDSNKDVEVKLDKKSSPKSKKKEDLSQEKIVQEEKEIKPKKESKTVKEKTKKNAGDKKANVALKKLPEAKEFKERKVKKKLWIFLLFVFLVLFVVSGWKIYSWQKDNKNIDTIVEELKEIVEIEEIEVDEEKEKLVNPPKKESTSDYWSYIKLPLINVDFTKLKEKNADTVAFLKVNGTNINYPVVQTEDNDFYLDHAYDKAKNSSGWVFMDYRNNLNNLDDNTIIYAHGRVNNTMFGSLKNIMKSNWYTDTDNYVVHMSSEKESMLWQVISVYTIPSETYYLTSQFGTEESKEKFIQTILERSEYNFNAEVNVTDKILTLSTCSNHTNRVVLHAKLIKTQEVE